MFIRKLHIKKGKQEGGFGLGLIGQATTELAVIGTIMILIFGAMLRYGINYNAQQQTQMYAFRKALELAKNRYNQKDADGRTSYAAVNLNVITSTYKPSEAGGAQQAETIPASSSAAIDAENEAKDFQHKYGAEDLDDVGATYYQIGSKMMVNGQYIEPPYIKVKRKLRDDKMPKTNMDRIREWLPNWITEEKEDTIVFQPLPYWEQEQYTNTTYNSQYETLELQDQAASGEVTTTHTVTETRYKPQPFDKMKEWDPDIIQIYGVEGYPGGPEDMVVTTDQTFTQARGWESQKQ